MSINYGLFERETAAVRFGINQALPHAYAQERYRELAGWDCPITIGKSLRGIRPRGRKSADGMAKVITYSSISQ